MRDRNLPVTPDDRAVALRARRVIKMSRSAHAYVRGSTERFYAWIDEHRIDVPVGPALWICGDCHSGNIGPLADAEGRVDVQIRDFDQTVVGHAAWDLLRLQLSLASAARGMDLAGQATLKMIEATCRGYGRALLRPGAAIDVPGSFHPMMRVSVRRAWTALARERLKGLRPSFPLGSDFWPLSDAETAQVQLLFSGDEGRARLMTVLGLHGADDPAPVILDAAYWVKGCSSLGLLRVAVLVATGRAAQACLDHFDGDADHNTRAGRRATREFWKAIESMGDQGVIRLVDIKEAVASVAPSVHGNDTRALDAAPGSTHATTRAAPPAPYLLDQALRVQTGAQAMSPHLGDRMAIGRLGRHTVFLRELMPQDLKPDFAGLGEKQAIELAGWLGAIVGRAHGRQLRQDDRRAWAAAVRRSETRSLDAPSWTWNAVRDLMAVHEAAYLDHCRRAVLVDG